MRRNIIIVGAIVGVGGLLLWWALQPPPDVETKGGSQEMLAIVSLITAMVGLLTSIVTLVTTLVKARSG